MSYENMSGKDIYKFFNKVINDHFWCVDDFTREVVIPHEKILDNSDLSLFVKIIQKYFPKLGWSHERYTYYVVKIYELERIFLRKEFQRQNMCPVESMRDAMGISYEEYRNASQEWGKTKNISGLHELFVDDIWEIFDVWRKQHNKFDI
jgi:hypothetical protein